MRKMRLVIDFEDEDSVLFEADFGNRTVRTNCGDYYYDYDVSFDDFIKFAHYIEREDERTRNDRPKD